jgi:hypothetical protein
MLRLTLRTLLAYLDDTLNPADARQMGQKVAENPTAQELVDRIRKVTRRRGLSTPSSGPDGSPSDPNTVAEYLSDALIGDRLNQFEQACLEQDVHLAEVAACHQILTMVLSEPVRVPPTARRRMYQIVKGRESIPDRKPGNTVPVGGVFEEDKPADTSDDADAPYLLGMNAYSKEGLTGRFAAFAATAAGLAVALGVAVWMTLPAAVSLEQNGGFAQAPATKGTEPAVTDSTPEKDKPAEVPPPPKPVEPGADPKKEPTAGAKKEPLPEPKVEPPAAEPKKEPDGELVPAAPPPKVDKGQAGRVERPGSVVVLVKAEDGDAWKRANTTDPTIPMSQRVLSLPGYRSGVKLDSGVQVDLWGNLPELLPSPLLESEVTFHVPYDGFDADLTFHTGRVYLTAKKPGGGKARLRFADQVWDVTLPDEKTDVAFETVLSPVRGAATEPPRVSGVLAVLSGTAGLKVRYKDIPQIGVGEIVYWDNKGKGLDGPKKADPNAAGKPPVYFSRFPLGQDADQARKTNGALDELSRRLSDPNRVKVVFAELLQDRTDSGAVPAARVAVLGESAIREWAGLVDAINDTGRPYVREVAVIGLQNVLLADPGGAKEFRRLSAERYRTTDEQVDVALKLLRGFSEIEKKKPETIDTLVDALASPSVAVRELAIMNLLTDVDPDARNTPALTRFDAGASVEARDAVVKAWKRRAEEWKKKLQPTT